MASARQDSLDEVSSSSSEKGYQKVYRHWFYQHIADTKKIWTPFTMTDSNSMDDAYESHDSDRQIVVTDGGRFDVNIPERKRTPVYWKGESNDVRRCSWFYKIDSRSCPYEEGIADLLEHEFKEASSTGDWHRRIQLPNGELVVFHDSSVIVHFQTLPTSDSWGAPAPTSNRPRVVKRGCDEFTIEEGEPEKIDHILFMVHGIGSVCDLKLRTVEEVVDEFRSIAQQLIQSHYRSAYDEGEIGRVEVLPVSWYNSLHSEESGIDQKLKAITLESIPKLRNFTNETLLDVLFYTSPVYSQGIIDTVANCLNRKYALFLRRNKNFTGRVSVAGHSLGSLILFDLLCHQKPKKVEKENKENPDDSLLPLASRPVFHKPLQRTTSKQINYTVGCSGTGQPQTNYPQLTFEPKNFFLLGSPVGMFVTVRGIDKLGIDFRLPTCEGFYNIFHPYDPVAYRCEALVNPDLSTLTPVLIPHHKGRKRMHLELRETMTRVSADIKDRFMSTFKNTFDTVCSLNPLSKRLDHKAIEQQVEQVLQTQLSLESPQQQQQLPSLMTPELDDGHTHLPLGDLNKSKRVDYVLQEAPLEYFNEYLFALTSHVCYWDSEDTILFIMKEIYSSMGVEPDNQVPQHSMTIERPQTSESCNNFSSADQPESSFKR